MIVNNKLMSSEKKQRARDILTIKQSYQQNYDERPLPIPNQVYYSKSVSPRDIRQLSISPVKTQHEFQITSVDKIKERLQNSKSQEKYGQLNININQESSNQQQDISEDIQNFNSNTRVIDLKMFALQNIHKIEEKNIVKNSKQSQSSSIILDNFKKQQQSQIIHDNDTKQQKVKQSKQQQQITNQIDDIQQQKQLQLDNTNNTKQFKKLLIQNQINQQISDDNTQQIQLNQKKSDNNKIQQYNQERFSFSQNNNDYDKHQIKLINDYDKHQIKLINNSQNNKSQFNEQQKIIYDSNIQENQQQQIYDNQQLQQEIKRNDENQQVINNNQLQIENNQKNNDNNNLNKQYQIIKIINNNNNLNKQQQITKIVNDDNTKQDISIQKDNIDLKYNSTKIVMKISDENDDSEDNVKKQIQFDQYEEKEVVELDFDQVRDYINMIERLKLELNHQKNKENDLKKEIGNLIKMIQKLNQSNEKQKFEMQEYINEKKIHEEAFTNRIVELGSQIQSYKQEIQQLKNKIQIQEEQDVIQDTIKSQRQQMAEMERFSQQQMEDKKCLERLISEMMIEKAQQQSPQKRTLQSENFNSPKQQIYSKDFKHLMPQNDYEQMLSDIYNKTNHMQKKNVQNEITQINKDSIDRQIKLQNEYDKLMLQINNRSKVDYLGFQKNDIAEISDHFQNVYNHNLKKSSQSIQSITSPYRAHNSSSPYIAHCDENQPKESQSQEQNQVEKGGQKNKKLHTNNELKSQESYQYSPLSQKQKFINNSPNIGASPNKNLNLQGYIGEPQSIQKYNDALNILRNSKKSQFFSSSKKQQDPSSTEENYRNIQKQITDYINQEKLLFN